MISELQSKHGIKELDIVVANAAIGSEGKNFMDISDEQLELIWRTNVSRPHPAHPEAFC